MIWLPALQVKESFGLLGKGQSHFSDDDWHLLPVGTEPPKL